METYRGESLMDGIYQTFKHIWGNENCKKSYSGGKGWTLEKTT